jgi:hypothetical protein
MMLCRVHLPQIPGTADQGSARKKRSGSLTAGVFAEIELRATQAGWKGKVDLLVISPDACEIVDFKTGAQDEQHRFQIRVYALLWSRDNELNPSGRLATRLILRYSGADVDVVPPTRAELDDLEREVVDSCAIGTGQQRPSAFLTLVTSV